MSGKVITQTKTLSLFLLWSNVFSVNVCQQFPWAVSSAVIWPHCLLVYNLPDRLTSNVSLISFYDSDTPYYWWADNSWEFVVTADLTKLIWSGSGGADRRWSHPALEDFPCSSFDQRQSRTRCILRRYTKYSWEKLLGSQDHNQLHDLWWTKTQSTYKWETSEGKEKLTFNSSVHTSCTLTKILPASASIPFFSLFVFNTIFWNLPTHSTTEVFTSSQQDLSWSFS